MLHRDIILIFPFLYRFLNTAIAACGLNGELNGEL